MAGRLRGMVVLTLVIGVLGFLWTEFVLNFTFHWTTVQDQVFGKFGLPGHFYLVLPASFVSWGMFFAAGADNQAFVKVAIAAFTGSLAGLVLMGLGPVTADAPDFWGIALWVLITAMALVLLSAVDPERFSPALAFICYGSVFFWWNATGLDNFVAGGKGPHTVQALQAAITNKPLAAGSGAFGGLLSTPWPWVAINIFASLICGALLGVLSVRLTGAIGNLRRPRPSGAATAAPGT
jgi:hypothetical protein